MFQASSLDPTSRRRQGRAIPALRLPRSNLTAAARLTLTVETVEKVTFQKLIFEKWGRNIEKRLVFCVLNNILAIFEPVVGDFCESFSNKGFFDSLVRQHSPEIASRWLGANISYKGVSINE